MKANPIPVMREFPPTLYRTKREADEAANRFVHECINDLFPAVLKAGEKQFFVALSTGEDSPVVGVL